MVTRGRFMGDEHELLDRARDWITGIKGQFREVPPGEGAAAIVPSPSPSASRCCEDQRCRCCRSPSARSRSSSSGPRWGAVFEDRWPHYQAWFLREGEAARPSYATSVRMLRAHMPELLPAYERVVRARGRGRPRRADALPLQAAALPRGVLPGRMDPRRRSGARAQLRLRPLAASRDCSGTRDCSDRGDRDERLPMGPAGRDERRRPRGLVDVRWPAGLGRWVRHPASSCATCSRRAGASRRREQTLARLPYA